MRRAEAASWAQTTQLLPEPPRGNPFFGGVTPVLWLQGGALGSTCALWALTEVFHDPW